MIFQEMSNAFLLRFITGGVFLCLHGLHIEYSFFAFTKCLLEPQWQQTGKWQKKATMFRISQLFNELVVWQ